jgi:hypothetical protein
VLDWYSRWKFSFLLIALVGLLIVQALIEGFSNQMTLFHVLYSVVLVTIILTFALDKRVRLILMFLGLIALIGTWSVYSLGIDARTETLVVERGIGVVFFGWTAGLVLNRVLRQDNVTTDTLMGSVCAYLLIAAAWAMAYSALEIAVPGSFSATGKPKATDANINDWVYYSFMTLTTLGYGNIQPASRAAGMLSWMEAMAGQFYLAVLVARLVSLHVSPLSPVNDKP